MARSKKTTSAATELAKLSNQLGDLQRANTSLVESLSSDRAAVEATYRDMGSQPAPTPVPEKKLGKLLASVKEKNTKSHRVAVDLGGGFAAQVSTELINLGVRALARWSPTGWVGENVDVLQGAPHFILGLGLYIAEMASRKSLEMPSTTREVISEAAKIFSQLGFSNLTRALRVRYGDGKQKDLDLAALAAEKDELQKRLDALQSNKRQ
jgi:hypothetical protein